MSRRNKGYHRSLHRRGSGVRGGVGVRKIEGRTVTKPLEQEFELSFESDGFYHVLRGKDFEAHFPEKYYFTDGLDRDEVEAIAKNRDVKDDLRIGSTGHLIVPGIGEGCAFVRVNRYTERALELGPETTCLFITVPRLVDGSFALTNNSEIIKNFRPYK